MAELADAAALGAVGRKAVQVQVLFPAPASSRRKSFEIQRRFLIPRDRRGLVIRQATWSAVSTVRVMRAATRLSNNARNRGLSGRRSLLRSRSCRGADALLRAYHK